MGERAMILVRNLRLANFGLIHSRGSAEPMIGKLKITTVIVLLLAANAVQTTTEPRITMRSRFSLPCSGQKFLQTTGLTTM
jgi:hypothetical protein